MSRMTPEEARLRDEAISAGRMVRVERRAPRARPAPDFPDRVSQPRPAAQQIYRMAANGGVRQMPIKQALEWAFGSEHARLEFDEMGETSGNLRQGVDGIWLMMQRGALGCQIDGGGRSDPAWDAEVIASAVASLPMGWGGKRTASVVAECARAGTVPDWMPNTRPKVLPSDTHENQHGWTAATAESHHLPHGEGWPVQSRVGRKGRVIKEPVLYCPVYIAPTARQVHAARRRYLDWHGALLWIMAELQTLGILSTIEITPDLPPLTPWRAECG